MPTIKIDGKDYDTDDLSEETKAQLGSLQFVQAELGRLQAQAAALHHREPQDPVRAGPGLRGQDYY